MPSPAAHRLEHLTAKLQKIDEQLLAIQNLAENIEHNYPPHTVPDWHCMKVDCLYLLICLLMQWKIAGSQREIFHS